MDSKSLFTYYLEEMKHRDFRGWDFSYLTEVGRMVEAPLPWNLRAYLLSYLLEAETLLDMGTGGGEYLSNLYPLPEKTYATESYGPNIPLARERLEPLGVKVIPLPQEESSPYHTHLPFDSGYFDLIMNRHEAYDPRELERILKPGGLFITQQVGSLTAMNLIQSLKGSSMSLHNWSLQSAREELGEDFLVVDDNWDISYTRFYDIGAILFFLQAIPWLVEDFTLEAYEDGLYQLHLMIQKKGYIDIIKDRFLLLAKKVANRS